MEYRQVGNTELWISEIGFGCGGNAGLMVRGTPDEQRQVVARAVELGINYFDNAPDYGNGLAEENLGRVLKDLKLRPVITSKVEVRHADLGDIAGHVVRSTEESLKRLGVDSLDILQIPMALPHPLRSWKVASTLSSGSRIICGLVGRWKACSACCVTVKPAIWASFAAATMPIRSGNCWTRRCFR